MTRTSTLCKYPECNAVGRRSWALLPVCQEHREAIRLETLQYYENRLPYPERKHYLKIARLIKQINPLYAQTVTKNGVEVKKPTRGDAE